MVSFSVKGLCAEGAEDGAIARPNVEVDFAFEIDPEGVIFIAILVTKPAHVKKTLNKFGIENFWDHI